MAEPIMPAVVRVRGDLLDFANVVREYIGAMGVVSRALRSPELGNLADDEATLLDRKYGELAEELRRFDALVDSLPEEART